MLNSSRQSEQEYNGRYWRSEILDEDWLPKI